MKKLMFLHITKSAGTAVEDYFVERALPLGRFDYFYKSSRMHWHTPPIAFDKKTQVHFLEEIKNKTSFTVCRNPIDRIESEMRCRWGNHLLDKSNSSAFTYNKILFLYLLAVIIRRLNENACILLTRFRILPRTGTYHWTPQVNYLAFFRNNQVPLKIVPFDKINLGLSSLVNSKVKLSHVNVQRHSKNYKQDQWWEINFFLARIAYKDDISLHSQLVQSGKSVISLSELRI
jgi:hypothetical protein